MLISFPGRPNIYELSAKWCTYYLCPGKNVYLIYKKENKTNEANQKPENVRKCYTLGGVAARPVFQHSIWILAQFGSRQQKLMPSANSWDFLQHFLGFHFYKWVLELVLAHPQGTFMAMQSISPIYLEFQFHLFLARWWAHHIFLHSVTIASVHHLK